MWMTRPDGRLRLTLLGGALGSGKTTWARHQLHLARFGRSVHVLVNEAAETPIDDQLLTGAQGVTVLAGGCACCTGRAALMASLRELCNRRSSGGALQPDRVLLETSGLADPGAIVRAIQADPVLLHHILLDEVIVAVDALHALAQLRDEPLCRRQIAAADRMILTKADVAPPAALNILRATLRQENGHAATEACAFGETLPLPPLPPEAIAVKLPDPDAADCRGPPVTASLRLPAGLDWSDTLLWLSALLHARGDEIVRVKGVLRTPAGRILLQSVCKVVQQPEILPDTAKARADDVLVVIGRGFRGAELDRSIRRFLGGAP
ncbi:MAG: GTP-binding protein [Tabrizicola sp.]|nr:GTP-binding protein [Tabrizicola sp.]